MIVVLHFRVEAETFADDLQTALTVLAARPGYVRGSGARSTDDIADWVMVTEWASVGAYRRALGNYDVKVHAAPVLGRAIDQATAFEQLVTVDADGTVARAMSDRVVEAAVDEG
ncbi:MAG: Antibiotic biosynthesis monooxygenase [Pseudonocardiales bacterium]|nr:Antibiotic biosynthesis monooxygenase [Pseudonocardiales bacterium]